MSDEIKTSAELRKELAAAKMRSGLLKVEKDNLTARLAAVDEELRTLHGSPFGHGPSGTIHRLEQQLRRAIIREQNETLPVVRVGNKYGYEEWRFVKRTPKRIYLRSCESGYGIREEFWGTDGEAPYRNPIHPDDLTAILSGTISGAKP